MDKFPWRAQKVLRKKFGDELKNGGLTHSRPSWRTLVSGWLHDFGKPAARLFLFGKETVCDGSVRRKVATLIEGFGAARTLKGLNMKTNPLDELLSSYAKQPLPPPPGGASSEIWREIETRRRRSFWTRVLPLLDWRELFLEPKLAAAALALAIAVGMLPGYFAASRFNADARLARESLHFEVFSGSATDLLANRPTLAKLWKRSLVFFF